MLASREEREGADMSEQMITFDQGRARFNLRVAGVALNGDGVLVHRTESDDFWTLPGGRGELLEPARDALKREMREELGVNVEVGRLVWIVENFFDYDGRSYHELALLFLMTLPRGSNLHEVAQFEGKERLDDGSTLRLIFRWFVLDELDLIPLYPSFLRQSLKAIPASTEHVVHED